MQAPGAVQPQADEQGCAGPDRGINQIDLRDAGIRDTGVDSQQFNHVQPGVQGHPVQHLGGQVPDGKNGAGQ